MPQTWFHFTVQKRPLPGSVSGSSGASLAKRPHLESGNEVHPSGKKSVGGSVSTSFADTRRKGGHGGWCSDVLQSSVSSLSSSAVLQVGMLFKFFNNGEALHLTGLFLIWFGVSIFRFGPALPCL